MNIFIPLKTTVIAGILSLTATIASAAPLAQLATSATIENNNTQFQTTGSFTATYNPAFDFTDLGGTRIDIETTSDTLQTFNESIIAPYNVSAAEVTQILALIAEVTVFYRNISLSASFPDTVFFETFEDSDTTESAIGTTGLFYNFIFTDFQTNGSTTTGEFYATLSIGAFDPLATMGASNNFTTSTTISVIPLPASLPLLAFGAAGLAAIGRRRKS